MQNNKYILIFLSVFSLLCISFISLSFYANPYKIKSFIPSLNTPSYFGGTRTAKALEIIDGDYNAFILGSSRSEIGIDPSNQLWGELNVYNASLSGSSFTETYKVFETILKHKKPKLIVLALDYSLFSTSRGTSADFTLSRFDNSNNSFFSFFKERLSKEAIEKSFRALKYSNKNLPAKHFHGQKDGDLTFSKKITPDGQRSLVLNTLIKQVINNDESYSSGRSFEERLKLLSQLIKSCSDQDIQLIIFISPIHALQLMTFQEIGIWDAFLNWKKELTNITRQFPQTSLYDFTDLNPLITEKIPDNNDGFSMYWFWETSHYKSILGNEILKNILAPLNSKNQLFGTKLNEQNITNEISKQNLYLNRYVQQNKALLNDIRQLTSSKN